MRIWLPYLFFYLSSLLQPAIAVYGEHYGFDSEQYQIYAQYDSQRRRRHDRIKQQNYAQYQSHRV